MLAQYLHHASVGSQIVVLWKDLSDEAALGDFKNILPAIGVVLVGAEYAKVSIREIQLHHVAQKLSLYSGRFDHRGAGSRDLHGVLAEVRHAQIFEQQSTIGVRI